MYKVNNTRLNYESTVGSRSAKHEQEGQKRTLSLYISSTITLCIYATKRTPHVTRSKTDRQPVPVLSNVVNIVPIRAIAFPSTLSPHTF